MTKTKILWGAAALTLAAYTYGMSGCTTTGGKTAATATKVPTNTNTPLPPTATFTPSNTPTNTAAPIYTIPAGSVFLLGGDDGSAVANTAWRASMSGGNVTGWTTGPALPGTHPGYVGAAVGSTHVYACGGANLDLTQMTASVYSSPGGGTFSGTWTSQAAMPSPVAGMLTAYSSSQNRIVGAGVLTSSGTPYSVYVWPTVWTAMASGASVTGWATTAALPSAWGFGALASGGGYVYAISGYWCPSGCTNVTDVQYGMITSSGVNSWTTTTALPIAMSFNQACSDGSYVYVTGDDGAGSAAAYSAPIQGGGALGTWTSTTAAPADISFGYMTASGGYVYLFGGNDGSAVSTTVYSATSSGGVLSGWTSSNTMPAMRENQGGASN